MSECYELQSRLQELIAMCNVSVRNFKSLHHVSSFTLYQFINSPQLARPRTLTSIRLICEFLNSAYLARLLPLRGEERRDMSDRLQNLYEIWWTNGKKFPAAASSPVE